MMNDWFNVSSDITGHNHGSSFWNHDNGYQMQSLTADSDSPLGWLLDPTGTVAGLWNDITGASAQSREFSQQEYLMDKQNEYNLPVNQMARMKAAGINPNTAAQGISQGGNESAQAPAVASNEQGVANGIGQAAAAVSGIGALPASVANLNAEAAAKEAEALRSNTLLPFDTALTLENIGLTKANAQAVAIENYYRPTNLMLDISQKRLTLPILRKQFEVLDSEYQVNMKSLDKMIQDIEESKARVSLMDYTARLQAAQTQLAQAEANFISRKFQLLRDLNWDVTTGLGGLLAGYAVYDGVDSLELNLGKLQDTLFKVNYSESSGSSIGSLTADKSRIGFEYQQKKGLARLQRDIDMAVNRENRKGEFWNKTADKWIRVPSSAGVGPFNMSTQ